MPSFYTNGFSTPAAAAGAPYATIHTGSTLVAEIREIGIFLNAATSSSIGLIRAANSPVASTSQLGQAQDASRPASTVNVDTAWSTAPTIGSIYLRKVTLPATAGAGLIWTWMPDEPLVISVSSWLVIWNYGGSAGSVLNGYVTWLE
jgi:hypothetical protein